MVVPGQRIGDVAAVGDDGQGAVRRKGVGQVAWRAPGLDEDRTLGREFGESGCRYAFLLGRHPARPILDRRLERELLRRGGTSMHSPDDSPPLAVRPVPPLPDRRPDRALPRRDAPPIPPPDAPPPLEFRQVPPDRLAYHREPLSE